MVRVMHRAQEFLSTLEPALAPLEKLRAVVRWTLQVQLAGQMPSLPSQNSTLRAALVGHKPYLDALVDISDRLGGWIEEAQADGSLSREIPAIVMLYTLYARACDPVLGFLKTGGQHDDAQIIEWVLRSCFDGLKAR
jgi:hypothetical protein